MFDYLQKYNNLPKEMRDKLSSSQTVAVVDELEKKYGISLAPAVIKIAVKDVDINGLAGYFGQEFKLDEKRAGELSHDLREKIFKDLLVYLGVAKKSELEIKPESPRRTSFFISAEDEKEIRELAEKIGAPAENLSPENQTEEKISRIIKNLQINFGSELLAGRFKNILKTYIRGIRGKIETKQAFIKPIESGGLGFDSVSAEKILLAVDKNSQLPAGEALGVKTFPKIKVAEDELSKEKLNQLRSVGVRDFDYDLSSLKKAAAPKLDLAHELAPGVPVLFEKKAALEKEKIKAEKELISEKISKEKIAPPPFIKAKEPDFSPRIESASQKIRIMPQTGGKVKMDDIKFEPRTMGPIDELRYMNLINFRRLDKNPLRATEKIKEKINLLEEEYSKKLEGIKAWRLSPLNKLYLEMGSLSISAGKPIGAVIEERKTAGKDFLNNQEFEAIIKLNKDLRF